MKASALALASVLSSFAAVHAQVPAVIQCTDLSQPGATPCQNGGSCSSMMGTQMCTCATADFSGRLCEVRDVCNMNGGTAAKCGGTDRGTCVGSKVQVHEAYGYSCGCTAGYTASIDGHMCCTTATAQCSNGLAAFKDFNCNPSCICPDGFVGHVNATADPTCSIPSIACAVTTANPCQNGGYCFQYTNPLTQASASVCQCLTGYSGPQCATAVVNTPCDGGPCKNSGTCTVLFGSFFCTCVQNWGGTQCDLYEDTNQCPTTVNPCGNNGNCQDGFNDYSCTCNTGWGGDLCQTPVKVPVCASNPCQNAGTCKPIGNGDKDYWSCTCAPKYFGNACEQYDAVDDCNPMDTSGNPLAKPCCSKGADCLDLYQTALCTCKDGYSGQKCDGHISDGTTLSPTQCAGTATCYKDLAGAVCGGHGNCVDFASPTPLAAVPGVTAGPTQCQCVSADGYLPSNDLTTCCLASSSTCVHGTAVFDNSCTSTTCTCNTGYTGPTCSDTQSSCSACLTNSCLNGGTCQSCLVFGSAVQECLCPSGFLGASCSEVAQGGATNECASKPCTNGGTCTDMGFTFNCRCTAEYVGMGCNELGTDYGAPCTSNPCQNGGTCAAARDLSDGLNMYTFACTCPTGFNGQDCGNKDNGGGCDSNPCKNGGSCLNYQSVVICSCVEGFGGDFCSNSLTGCASFPCQNGGTCNVGTSGGDHTCACAPNYGGLSCETHDSTDQCTDPSYAQSTGFSCCEIGGDCLDLYNTAMCTCKDNWSGAACNQHVENGMTAAYTPTQCTAGTAIGVDACQATPCANGATCYDLQDAAGYSCQCAQGFTGTTCGDRAGSCSSSPCQNGGTCTSTGVDSTTVFSCNCPKLYFGDVCDQYDPVDDCNPVDSMGKPTQKPCCAKGVTDPGCFDFFHLAVCQCDSGWTGDKCNQNQITGNTYQISQCNAQGAVGTDSCASNPCQNSGACTDLQDTATGAQYTCACPAAYCGGNCETNDVTCLQSSVCLSAPCQNGGTCGSYAASGAAFWQCTCPPQYFGADCGTYDAVDNCATHPVGFDCCAQGGDCVNMYQSAQCICKDGFMQTQTCNQKTSGGPALSSAQCSGAAVGCGPCTTSTCQNSGTCQSCTDTTTGAATQTCTCTNGYTGASCETAPFVDNCNPSPCHNGGTCSLFTLSFECSCTSNYGGITCDDSAPSALPCASNPCQNGGTCQDTRGDANSFSYTCLCAAGFSGAQSCQYTASCSDCSADDKALASCQNGGWCTSCMAFGELIPLPQCNCGDGFTGDSCETKQAANFGGDGVDDCKHHPCHNKGNCTDIGSDFKCRCTDTFVGKSCTTAMSDTKPCAKANNNCPVAGSTCRTWLRDSNNDFTHQCIAPPAPVVISGGHGWLFFSLLTILLAAGTPYYLLVLDQPAAGAGAPGSLAATTPVGEDKTNIYDMTPDSGL